MFVVHDVLLGVSFGVARARLVSLASSRALVDASRAAYQEGLASQRPGPELARVRFLPPVERTDSATVGMRWEASGVTAGLFPVLDANITLTAASEHTSTLTLSGVYRPPCPQPDHSLLGAPVPDRLSSPAASDAPPGAGTSGAGAAPGLMAETAVRALLRYAAGYLAR